MVPLSSNAPVRVGDIVAGKYRVERILGSGGMGVVVAANHMTLGEPVALKFLLARLGHDDIATERLLREARATFRLRSEHTVRVYDVGQLEGTGEIYIVMELLEGRDLKMEVAARGALPEIEAVGYALQACDALEEAHAVGIVHRDLKPHNLFLAKTPHGRSIVKVLDFGVSKVDPEFLAGGPLTRPETALGTPRYMAPEQWKSAATVDARADIWALGMVLYELLTGAPLLVDVAPDERRARLLAGAVPSPREVCPEVTEGVARAVMRCLRADPSGRWPSIVHFATALRHARPEAASQPSFAEVTRTGITAVIPPSKQAARAAQAFAEAPVSIAASPRAETPRTASDESPTIPKPRTSIEPVLPDLAATQQDAVDFDDATEVRPPLFSQPDTVEHTAVMPGAPPRPLPRGGPTLRSEVAPPQLVAQLDAAIAAASAPMIAPPAPHVAKPKSRAAWIVAAAVLLVLALAAAALVIVRFVRV